jgi:Domain of unknown function (DUF4365)
MIETKDAWFLEMRSEAIASLLLTSRPDVHIVEQKKTEDSGIDILINVSNENGRWERLLAVQVKGTLSVDRTEWKKIAHELYHHGSRLPFLPACAFIVNVKSRLASYVWLAKPVVEAKIPRLEFGPRDELHDLEKKSIDEIVTRVQAWYNAISTEFDNPKDPTQSKESAPKEGAVDFQKKADEFIAAVKAAKITWSTDVDVVYYCIDERGDPIPPFRMSLVPNTRVSWPGNPQGAKCMVEKMHIDTVIGNINSLIRPGTPERFSVPEDAPRIPMTLERIELEIAETNGTHQSPNAQDELPANADMG